MMEIVILLVLSAIITISVARVMIPRLEAAMERFAIVRWVVYLYAACMVAFMALFIIAVVLSTAAEYAEERRVNEFHSVDN